MASIHLGGEPKRGPTPADPSDLNRCLLLLEAAPEIRESFPTIAAHSPQWAALIARWEEVEALFMEECGRDWSKSSVGKRTYRLMCEISDGVNSVLTHRTATKESDGL